MNNNIVGLKIKKLDGAFIAAALDVQAVKRPRQAGKFLEHFTEHLARGECLELLDENLVKGVARIFVNGYNRPFHTLTEFFSALIKLDRDVLLSIALDELSAYADSKDGRQSQQALDGIDILIGLKPELVTRLKPELVLRPLRRALPRLGARTKDLLQNER